MQGKQMEKENMTCTKVIGEKEGGIMGQEKSSCEKRNGEGKKGSENRCVETEVNNRDDDKNKRGWKERNNRKGGRVKSQRPCRCNTEELL